MYLILFFLVSLQTFRGGEGLVFHTLAWTAEGLANYSLQNPLIVRVNDVISITDCLGYDVYVLLHGEQYEACACDTSSYTCADARPAVRPCIDFGNTIRIVNPPGNLGAVDAYPPGNTYYLAGFPEGSQSCDSNRLRAVFMVAEDIETTAPLPTTLPTTLPPTQEPVTDTATSSSEINSTSFRVVDDNTNTTPQQGTSENNGSATRYNGGTTRDNGSTTVNTMSLETNRMSQTIAIAVPLAILIPGLLVAIIVIVWLILFYVNNQTKQDSCPDDTVCYEGGAKQTTFDRFGRQVSNGGNTQSNTQAQADFKYVPSKGLKEDPSLKVYEPMTDDIRSSQSNLLQSNKEWNGQDAHGSEKSADGRMKEYRRIELVSEVPTAPPLSLENFKSQSSVESEDLINLQTPTHSINPQSSIVAFTLLAQTRATETEIMHNGIKEESDDTGDTVIAKEKSFPLSKSQSVEFLDRIGNAPSSPKTLPRKGKLKNASSVDNLADDSSKSAQKTRTLPRPKLTRRETKRKESAAEVVPGESLVEAKKRLSTFEKSGEVFSLTESL